MPIDKCEHTFRQLAQRVCPSYMAILALYFRRVSESPVGETGEYPAPVFLE
jgi:hypothetical protein